MAIRRLITVGSGFVKFSSLLLSAILLKLMKNNSWLPWSWKSQGKLNFIQGRGKVRDFCIRSGANLCSKTMKSRGKLS